MVDKQFSNDKSSLIQFLKYGISGAFAMLTHIVVFYLSAWKLFPALQENDTLVALLELQVAQIDVSIRSANAMLSNIFAFFCSNIVAYICNILWVFEPGRHNKLLEISLFYLVSGLSTVIGTGMMGYLIRNFEFQTTIAFTANIITAVMINYVMRKFYIFKG